MDSIIGIIIIVVLALAALGFGLFKLNQWALRKNDEQQKLIASTKQQSSIFVIDKKKEKLSNANLPKNIYDKIPKLQRNLKMPLVKAKVGSQITTLITDKKIYEKIPLKKNVQVEIAGIYIVSLKGFKPDKK
jgi:L-cystine uptake protein TcyP (sodium:dicarboxylate symporter family)